MYEWKEREPKEIWSDEQEKDIPNPNAGNVIYWTAEDEVANANHKEGTPKKTETMSLCSCNITCLAMLLQYCGITDDTPDDIMEKIFSAATDEDNDELRAIKEENYSHGPSNVLSIRSHKRIVKALYNIDTVDLGYSSNLEYLKETVASGFPVMISCGILRRHTESFYQSIIDGASNAHLYSYSHDGIRNVHDDLLSIYRNNYGTSYEEDLSEALEELEAASTDEEINTANQKIETIENQQEQVKEEVLQYCLDDYRTHGHYIVVRGFTEDSVIINDPWGDPTDFNGNFPSDGKGNYYNSSPFGDNITISLEDFEKQYNADGTLWSSLVIRHNLWNFVFASNTDRRVVPPQTLLNGFYEQEIYEYGGYPMKRSNLWHNGIHLKADNIRGVYPIGPGQIIAARILDEDLSNPDNNPAPINGNRCFVLIKHNLNINSEIKSFFSLYMHLKPEENLESKISNYPVQPLQADWLEEIIFRSKKVMKVKDSRTPSIFSVEDDRNLGSFTAGTLFPYESCDDQKIYFNFEISGQTRECYSFMTDDFYIYPSAYKSNSEEIMDKYQSVLDSLAQGRTTYFTELPDPVIEVTASTCIGKTGVFGGYNAENRGMIHLEIFSDDIIIPQFDEYGFNPEPIYLEDSPTAMCNREEMIGLFDKFGLYNTIAEGSRFIHLQDGIISKAEMQAYYNQKPAILRNMICQHKSEWYEGINWEDELANAVGVPFGIPLIHNVLEDKLIENLQEYINRIYNPYKWLNDGDCLNAMNLESSDNLANGCATYYHPIKFLEWLVEYQNQVITD